MDDGRDAASNFNPFDTTPPSGGVTTTTTADAGASPVPHQHQDRPATDASQSSTTELGTNAATPQSGHTFHMVGALGGLPVDTPDLPMT